MKTLTLSAAFVAAATLGATSSSASAQVGVETFANGNPNGWQIWFAPYNYLRATGGNPDEYFELDDFTSGPATCQYVRAFPDRQQGGVVLTHAGNWRTAGVDQVSIDLNIQQGVLGEYLTLILVSDPGTPTMAADDCAIRLRQTMPGPMASGWTTLSFPVDASQVTVPLGWTLDPISMGCLGASLTQVWNTVIQDVDEVRFEYGNTSGFCTFTRWVFGMDNIQIGTPAPAGPGTPYCTANANSSGAAAAMGATGSNAVITDNVTLQCNDMPLNAFGFFLTSQMQGLTLNPGGSQGNLCLGGSIGRYVGAGQVQNSGASGAIALGIQLGQHPTPTGLVQVAPGETWHFTCWFRDTFGGAATSNFANGYTILFM